ncbi:MAG: UDP-N-acetylmuramoyl-L-alanine--D-glutamate ligase [Oscillospiraceae bacterium]
MKGLITTLSLLKEKTDGKSVAILGFGREGRSTLNALQKSGTNAEITVLDKFDIADKKNFSVDFMTGDNYMDNLSRFDLIFKSPGIVVKDIEREKITSQTELFLQRFSSQTIGITGTKGKSTTTTLIHHILKNVRGNAVLAGNIGIPAFDRLDEINDETVIVYELSCHQLEFCEVSPHIAILLNLFPEHLDHYGTLENYYNAKRNIYLHQNENELLFCNADIVPENAKSRIISVSRDNADITFGEDFIKFGDKKISFIMDELPLIGMHNIYNIAMAFGVCSTWNIKEDDFLSSLKTYKSLPHRLEIFAEIDGVKYVDDSISTACETTEQAVRSLKNVGVLLIGGMDRGIDYAPLIAFLREQRLPNVICMYDSGRRIFNEAKQIDGTNLFLASDLKEACELAKGLAKSGEYCLLSPASASYGFFKNFEERGEKFKEYILR